MGSQNSTCRNSIEVEKSTSSKKSAIRSTVDEDGDNVVVCFSSQHKKGGVVENGDRCDDDPKNQANYNTADKSFIQTKGEKEQTSTCPSLMVSYNTIIKYNMYRILSKKLLKFSPARFQRK